MDAFERSQAFVFERLMADKTAWQALDELLAQYQNRLPEYAPDWLIYQVFSLLGKDESHSLKE